jgi:hypothetical protein
MERKANCKVAAGAFHCGDRRRKSIYWNYTSVLIIIFLMLAVVLVIRFLRTGGPEMLRRMSNFGHHEPSHSRHTHHDHHAYK